MTSTNTLTTSTSTTGTASGAGRCGGARRREDRRCCAAGLPVVHQWVGGVGWAAQEESGFLVRQGQDDALALALVPLAAAAGRVGQREQARAVEDAQRHGSMQAAQLVRHGVDVHLGGQRHGGEQRLLVVDAHQQVAGSDLREPLRAGDPNCVSTESRSGVGGWVGEWVI